jgi:ABC-type polysaccharide/polyol phosphate export permease
VIRAEPSPRGYTGVGEIRSLWTHRRALRSLALHDLNRTYSGSAIGILWAFIAPLIPMVTISAIFAFGLKLPLGGAPYIYGFAAGYVPWVLLSASISSAAGSIIDHRYLVKRIAFPVEIIPADAVFVHSLPHLLLLALTSSVCMIAGYGGLPDLFTVVYFYVCVVVFTLGAGLLLSSLAVVARDLQHMLPSILQVWFWLTPIAWASTALPAPAATLLALNPAGYIVAGYRYALMPKVFAAPSAVESADFWVISLGLLVIGSTCFRRLRGYFWDCL